MVSASGENALADELLLALGDADAEPEFPAQVRPARRKVQPASGRLSTHNCLEGRSELVMPMQRSRCQIQQVPATTCSGSEPAMHQGSISSAGAESSPLPEGLSPAAAGCLCHVPTELFMKVLGCLSAEELLTLTRVNSFFAKVASDQILWKRLCACRQAPFTI